MNKIAASIESRFTQAAGSSSNLLTKQQALASGWGWASDHFAEIDTQKKGAVSLDDVLNYITHKSGAALPRHTNSNPVQVIQ